MLPVAPYLLAVLLATSPEEESLCPPPEVASCSWEVSGDYLFWYLRKMPVPPLVTGGPAGGTGVIGDDATSTVIDDRLTTRHQRFIGLRFDIETWVPDRSLGFQVDAFFLERDSSHRSFPYGSVPTLAIPFVDAETGRPGARIVNGIDPLRGPLLGSLRVYSREELFGQEANVLFPWLRCDRGHLVVVAGTRFLQLRERLDLTSTSRDLPTQSVLYGLEDHFSVFNKFFGLQLGLEGEYRAGGLYADGKATVALGVDDQIFRAKGTAIYHDPNGRLQVPFGLFALPSNIGTHERAAFDVVGEVKGRIGYEFTANVRAHVGYSFLFWANPVRAGDQLGPVNRSQVRPGGLVGPALPDVPWNTEVFWAHGANVGVEIKW
jgi:hypothetical protein